MKGYSFQHILRQNLGWFCLIQEKHQHKKQRCLCKKKILEILKIALHLRDQHISMTQSLDVLHAFITSILNQVFRKTKTLTKKM